MTKIFGYELKRLTVNKFFLSLTIITGLHAYMVLSREIIIGVAYTAPFSPWSYGAYLANVLPLLSITLLFFVTFLYSNNENKVRQITFATPVDPFRYGLVKCAAMAAGFFIISFFVIAMSMVFYAVLFRFYGFGDFFIPAVITLFPCLLFVLGAGMMLGSLWPNILYVLMIAALLPGFLPLPAFADLYGGTFFGDYPLTLPTGPDGEPPFLLPVSFITGKLFFTIVGALMILFGIRQYAKKKT